MGRPPSFDPANRNPRVGPLQLPAEGRKGKAPPWPVSMGRARAGELSLWRSLWRSPQAVAWERMGVGTLLVVARYARYSVIAQREMDSTSAAAVMQLEDRLGLTPKSMRLMLWTIVGEVPHAANEQARREQEGVAGGSNVTDIRERIPAVAES